MEIAEFPVQSNTIVNISDFGVNMTPERLRIMFEKYGDISSYGILNNDEGWLRFGYVAFENLNSALEAVIEMNGQMIDDYRRIKVKIRREEKSKRPQTMTMTRRRRNSVNSLPTNEKPSDPDLDALLARKNKILNDFASLEVQLPPRLGRFSASTTTLNSFRNNDNSVGHSVFVKNLNSTTQREHLRAAFLSCGRILTTRIIPNQHGTSTYGFVTFYKAEEALRAVREKNGTLVGSRVVGVEIARGKRNFAGPRMGEPSQRR